MFHMMGNTYNARPSGSSTNRGERPRRVMRPPFHPSPNAAVRKQTTAAKKKKKTQQDGDESTVSAGSEEQQQQEVQNRPCKLGKVLATRVYHYVRGEDVLQDEKGND